MRSKFCCRKKCGRRDGKRTGGEGRLELVRFFIEAQNNRHATVTLLDGLHRTYGRTKRQQTNHAADSEVVLLKFIPLSGNQIRLGKKEADLMLLTANAIQKVEN